MPELGPAVSTVVDRCLAIKQGEDVLVIADAGTRAIGERLREAAAAARDGLGPEYLQRLEAHGELGTGTTV